LHYYSLLIAAICALVTFVLLRWLLGFAVVAQLLAKQNHRSLHSLPTPNIGGLVFVPVGALASWVTTKSFSYSVIGFFVLAVVGAIDDRRQLSAATRLPVHVLVSAAVAFDIVRNTIPQSNAATVVLLLVLVALFSWSINLFNFMDGSDGIAATAGIIGFGFYAWLADGHWIGLVASCIVGSLLGFLVLNWHPAKTFMGDAGSTTLGLSAAALGAAGWQFQLWHWTLPIAVFSPFLVDSTYTLARRVYLRERFWEGHKTHLYQRLVERFESAPTIALGYGCAGLIAGIISQNKLFEPDWVNVTFPVALICCYLAGVLLIERTLKRSNRQIRQ
jgi:UDP-N-acetylmuramyl pentapeptide phosphotransferase/UDP-N-acetylglucosamine-1-phosphate transferase